MMSSDPPASDQQAVGLGEADPALPGALVYEYAPLVTNIVEYGASADAMFAGEGPPPEGARLDLTLEGPIGGPKLNGTVKGKESPGASGRMSGESGDPQAARGGGNHGVPGHDDHTRSGRNS